MEMMQLEMFIGVVEERSVHKAAARVCRTQPAVSIALGKLAQEIGTPLFARAHKRDFGLTHAGEVLYEFASRIIGLRDEALSTLKQSETVCPGRIGVGVSGAAGLRLFLLVTKSFRLQYLNARIEMMCDSPEKLLHELAERKIDFVFLPSPPASTEAHADFLVAGLAAFGQSHLARQFEQASMRPADNGISARRRMRTARSPLLLRTPDCKSHAVS
jgi:DNA-binding transcriptional LysR family regulator